MVYRGQLWKVKLKFSDIDDLIDYFGKFEEVEEATIVKDITNDKTSGFGFVRFKSEEARKRVLKINHNMKGIKIDCKPALDKEKAMEIQKNELKRKLFVGGLPKNLKDSILKDYFSKFGQIEKAYVVKNAKTAKTRGKLILLKEKRFWLCFVQARSRFQNSFGN